MVVVVAVVGALRVTHSVGTTCRELDSFLRGDADELREETCKKILFIDAIRIAGRGGGEAKVTARNKYVSFFPTLIPQKTECVSRTT